MSTEEIDADVGIDTDTDVHGVPIPVGEPHTGPVSGIHLLCVAGPELGQRFPFGEASIVIGRGHGDVSLRAADVSRTHARISRMGGRFWIEDLDSANGTFVNGAAITGTTELRFGDRVQIGSTLLVFARDDELEQRLRQLQRLDAMNQLVKGIAHDFNNTLQVVLVGIEELRAMEPSNEMRAVLDGMDSAASSGAGLVRRLLRVGRDKPATVDLVDLDAVVRRAVLLGRRVMPAEIEIEVSGGVEVLVRGSSNELEQALHNVLVNARDAMPDGGVIAIIATRRELDRAEAHARHLKGPGTFAEIVVRDQGIGMNTETLARAFEPFFTTKPGKGTGLGLATLYSAIKNHEGMVELDSTPGAGTVVRILLPAVA